MRCPGCGAGVRYTTGRVGAHSFVHPRVVDAGTGRQHTCAKAAPVPKQKPKITRGV